MHTGASALILVVTNTQGNPVQMLKECPTGLPRTSKEDRDSHGFGLQSIRQIAQDHGGFLTVQGEDQIFLLRITFPFGTQSAA